MGTLILQTGVSLSDYRDVTFDIPNWNSVLKEDGPYEMSWCWYSNRGALGQYVQNSGLSTIIICGEGLNLNNKMASKVTTASYRLRNDVVGFIMPPYGTPSSSNSFIIMGGSTFGGHSHYIATRPLNNKVRISLWQPNLISNVDLINAGTAQDPGPWTMVLRWKKCTFPSYVLFCLEPKNAATANTFATNPSQWNISERFLDETKQYSVESFMITNSALQTVANLAGHLTICSDMVRSNKQLLIGNSIKQPNGGTIMGIQGWGGYNNMVMNSTPTPINHNYDFSTLTTHGSSFKNSFSITTNLADFNTFTYSSGYRFSCYSFKFYERVPFNFPLFRQMKPAKCTFNLILNSRKYLSRTGTGDITYDINWGLIKSNFPYCYKWLMQFSLTSEWTMPALSNNILIYCPAIANMQMNSNYSSGCIGSWNDSGGMQVNKQFPNDAYANMTRLCGNFFTTELFDLPSTNQTRLVFASESNTSPYTNPFNAMPEYVIMMQFRGYTP